MTAKERDPKDAGNGLHLAILRHKNAGPVETLFLHDGDIVPARRRLIVLFKFEPEKAADVELLAYGKHYAKALAIVPPPEFTDRDVPRLLVHRGTDGMAANTCIIPSAAQVPAIEGASRPTVKRLAALIDVDGERVVNIGLGDTGYERVMESLDIVRTLLRAKGFLRT